MQTPTHLYPEAAAYMFMKRVVRATQLPEEQEEVSVGWKGHCGWSRELGSLGSCTYCGPWSYIKL